MFASVARHLSLFQWVKLYLLVKSSFWGWQLTLNCLANLRPFNYTVSQATLHQRWCGFTMGRKSRSRRTSISNRTGMSALCSSRKCSLKTQGNTPVRSGMRWEKHALRLPSLCKVHTYSLQPLGSLYSCHLDACVTTGSVFLYWPLCGGH